MNWLKFDSIKAKLRLAFILVLGIVGFVILAFLWSERRNYQIDLSLSQIDQIGSAVKTLHIIQDDFFVMERVNPAFYKQGESHYLLEHQKSLEAIEQLIKSAQTNVNHQATYKALNQIRKITDSLEQNFDELVRLTLKLGYEDYGQIGKMRAKIHDIEQSEVITEKELIILLSIRRHEKDFLLRKDPKYQEKLQNSVAQLERLLKARQDSRNLAILMDYQEHFNEIVRTYQHISSAQGGLWQKLSQGQRRIEALTDKATHGLSQHARKQKYKNYLILLSILILMFLCTLSIFYIIIRQLGRPISQLSHNIKAIIEQDFDTEAQIEGTERKDEIGRLSQDFQLMLERVKSNRERIETEKSRVEKAYQRIDLLSEIGKQITSFLNVEDIMNNVYANLHRLMPADIIAVAIYDDDNNQLVFHQEGVQNPRYQRIPANDPQSLSSYCFTHRKLLHIADIHKEYKNYVDVILDIDDREPPRSRLYIPLVIKDRALGTISVQTFEADVYKTHHVDILENIANYTAIALDNAKIYEKVEEQREELRSSQEEIRQNMEEMLTINERIAESEAELKGQISAINRTLGMLEFDIRGTIVEANTIILHTLNYERDDLLGKSLRELILEKTLNQKDYHKLWQDLNQGLPQSGEFRLRSFYQQDVWLNATFTPILDNSRQTTKIIMLSSDITIQKQQSLEYQHQYEAIDKFNALVEFDSNGNVLKANQVFLDLLGYRNQEIIGMHHRNFMPEIERESPEYQTFLKEMLSGKLHQGEFRRIRKTGEEVWIAATYNPVYDLEGRLSKIVKFAQNITERKQLEMQLQKNLAYVQQSEKALRQNAEKLQQANEKLEESEQKFRQLIETNPVGIFIHNDKHIIYANPECEKIFGYKEEELLQMKLEDLVHQEYQQGLVIQQHASKSAQNEQTSRYEAKFNTKDGEERWIDLFYTNIEYGEQNELVFLVSVFDITDKKVASQKLENARNIIEDKNQALNQQKDQIERRNRELEIVVKQVNYQKSIIEKKNEDITASITYAKRIQEAMLPRPQEISAAFPNHFILFKPRDIVSGDFYWFCQKKYQAIIASVDCTGHGIPGAFMSLIGNDLLNEIVNIRNITEPNKILDELKRGINQVLRQEETRNQDGMDIAICTVDMFPEGYEDILGTPKLRFAGANTPLIYMQDGELHQIKGDKIIIGGFNPMERKTEFTVHTVDITKPTTFYIYSDGYQDQFGGEQKRKFMPRRLRNLIASIYDKPMHEQKQILDQTIEQWMAGQKQVDDMQVIGVRL